MMVYQKLQELIRRGRPQDLVEANQLMKVMTGYVSINEEEIIVCKRLGHSFVIYRQDQRQKPNYQQKFEEELHKIQEKVILLYEMLENVKPGEQINRNETLVELRNSSAGAQPKIQKMIQEEEDTEKIGKSHYGG